MVNTWTIYMYTFPNNKRYIGKTKRTMAQRKGNSETWEGYERCTLLWKAIQKYGVANIEETILVKEQMTDEQANELEKYYIALYKTNVNRYGKEYGYNLTDGGDGVSGIKYSEEEYQRRVEQMRQNGLKHKGVPLSEEHKKKLSEAKKGENNPNYGKHHSEETRAKIGKANSRENMSEETRQRRSNSKKKKIIAIHKETGEQIIFNSMTEASEYFHVGPPSVTRWCKKERNPSVPYIFDYYSANND